MTLENGILNRKSGFRNPRNFCLWNPESWAFESGIQLKESGIPLIIGIQNLSSTDKDWNPVPGIRNPRSGIQNDPESKIVLDSLSKAIWSTNVKQRLCYRLATKEVKRCNKYIITSYMAVFGSPIRYDSTVVLDVQEKQQSRKEGSETNNNTTQYWFLWPSAFITMPLGLMGIRGSQTIIVRAKTNQ